MQNASCCLGLSVLVLRECWGRTCLQEDKTIAVKVVTIHGEFASSDRPQSSRIEENEGRSTWRETDIHSCLHSPLTNRARSRVANLTAARVPPCPVELLSCTLSNRIRDCFQIVACDYLASNLRGSMVVLSAKCRSE